jgi:glycosyltransferase involved in cell wall biosynthesis
MDKGLRILHVPGRTPYSRKIRGEGMLIVNQTENNGVLIPRDASFDWIESQASLEFFDILHVQSLELTSLMSIEKALERCQAERKGIVITIHELEPLFPDERKDFADRVRLACRFASGIVTLTKRAGEEIAARFGVDPSRIEIVPHGAVLPLSHSLWNAKVRKNWRFTMGMFGGFRPNRSFLTAAINALYGLDSADVSVQILSRGLNPIEVGPTTEAWQVASLASSDKRLALRLLPFPSDDEIANFVHSLDVLVLPYLFGTHSGQLELAMDMGVPAIVPDIGCDAEQWRLHAGSVAEPYWFKYDPREPYSFGAPLLEAMRFAHANWLQRRGRVLDRSAFLAVRRGEQDKIVNAHRTLYARSIPA